MMKNNPIKWLLTFQMQLQMSLSISASRHFSLFSTGQELIFEKRYFTESHLKGGKSENGYTCCSIENSLLNKTISQATSDFIYKVCLRSASRLVGFSIGSAGVDL